MTPTEQATLLNSWANGLATDQDVTDLYESLDPAVKDLVEQTAKIAIGMEARADIIGLKALYAYICLPVLSGIKTTEALLERGVTTH